MKKDKEHKTALVDKTKSYSPLANTNQTQSRTQASKNDKRQQTHQGHLATRVNTTKVSKKDKDKDKNQKDSSHIEYCACKQKDPMLTSALKSQKTSSSLGYLYVNNWKNTGTRITVEMGILYSVPWNLQRLN